jgi:hypothetical protein
MYSLPAFEETHGNSMVELPSELGGQTIAMKPGQELVLSDRMLSDEELIAADGVAISPIEGELTIKGDGRLHLVRYSTKKFQQNEILIGCRTVTIPPTDRLIQVREAIARSAENEGSSPLARPAVKESNNLKAVALTQAGVLSGAQFGKALVDNKHVIAFAASGSIAEWKEDSASIELIRGCTLVAAHNRVEVTGFGASVNISKNAIALIKLEDHFIKIVNLTDLANNSVTVSAGTEHLSLLPGHELVLSDRAPNLSHIFDVHQVGHRTILSRQMNNKIWATTAEVALPDELIYQPLLRSVHTSDHPHAQAIINQVLKTAAVLQTIRHGSEYVRGETDDEMESSELIAHGCITCSH